MRWLAHGQAVTLWQTLASQLSTVTTSPGFPFPGEQRDAGWKRVAERRLETGAALLSRQFGHEDLPLLQIRWDFMEVSQTSSCWMKMTLAQSSQRELACHKMAPLSSFPLYVPIVFNKHQFAGTSTGKKRAAFFPLGTLQEIGHTACLAKQQGLGALGLFSLSVSNTVSVRSGGFFFLHRILNKEGRETTTFSDTFTATQHESAFPLNGREMQFYRL